MHASPTTATSADDVVACAARNRRRPHRHLVGDDRSAVRAQRHTTDKTSLRDAARLVPDVVQLLRRLAGDRTIARSVRIRLWLLLVYLILPIDLIPDFIPVLGYADDAIIVVVALRSITRRAGPEALEQHWPGTSEGLATLVALAGLGRRARPK